MWHNTIVSTKCSKPTRIIKFHNISKIWYTLGIKLIKRPKNALGNYNNLSNRKLRLLSMILQINIQLLLKVPHKTPFTLQTISNWPNFCILPNCVQIVIETHLCGFYVLIKHDFKFPALLNSFAPNNSAV